MNTPKPGPRPNPLRLTILGYLVSNDKGRLANNVSWENCDRTARRWTP
jgi:hypothetical protein